MHRFLTTLALLAASQFCAADTSQEAQRRLATELFKKFPCPKFEDESHRDMCELSRAAMDAVISMNRETSGSKSSLVQSESEWQNYYREQKEMLQEFRDEEARLRNKLKPKIGMTRDYIYKHVMGPPDSINETESASGIWSQWVYEGDDAIQYLYFNSKGILTSIQRRR